MTTTHSESPTLQEPVGDQLAAELLARRRKHLPAVTIALALLVAAAAAFLGGIEAQRHWGTNSTSTGSFASRFAAAAASAQSAAGSTGRPSGFPSFGTGGSASGAFAGFGGTTGTVTLIKGSTLYVTNSAGNTVLVRTSPTSRVSKTVSGSVKTIHPGDTVTIVGSQQNDGSYTARQVTIGASNG
jgi:hypothetical protein